MKKLKRRLTKAEINRQGGQAICRILQSWNKNQSEKATQDALAREMTGDPRLDEVLECFVKVSLALRRGGMRQRKKKPKNKKKA